MKRSLLTLLIFTVSMVLFSQAPEGFSYHAMVRDNIGNPLVNQAVSFRFTIHEGNPSGASVFEEEHYVTTDDFGVVSLIINNGINKTGIFENIDWGGSTYFLQVEVDKTGGTSYSDMGTTQLMSVPFALHAKTAANVFSGSYNDLTNKPITDGSETKLSAGSHIVLSGTGTSANPYMITNSSDGSETKVSAGSLITVTGTGTSADPYVISGSNGSETIVTGGNNIITSGSGTSADPYVIKERTHYIGESWGGGIVFYVYDNGRHGLIASTTDQDLGVEWYNGIKRYTNTTGDGICAGEMNTTLIIALQTNDNQTGNFAAKVCADYSVTSGGVIYGDWYLPSKFELSLMYSHKNMIGVFGSEYYWSSTELSSISAWCVNFSNGTQLNLNKNLPYGVRAVRAF